MKFSPLLSVAVYLGATSVAAATTVASAVEQPSSAPIYLQPIVQGCFSSAGDLVYNSSQNYNSRGKCGQDICQAMGKNVAASTQGMKCYCGDSYPPKDSLVNDKFCNTPCTGYGKDACGGTGYWTVYNTGLLLSGVPYAKDHKSSSSSASTTSTKAPSTTVVGGQTIFVTQSSEAPEKSNPPKSNKVGIAVGSVVGVLGAGALAGTAFFLLRRRRNKEIEEEHRRNAAVNAFFTSKPGSSSNGYTPSDARLDPVMAQRRLSDGSIADNEDYSRRILRVTNA